MLPHRKKTQGWQVDFVRRAEQKLFPSVSHNRSTRRYVLHRRPEDALLPRSRSYVQGIRTELLQAHRQTRLRMVAETGRYRFSSKRHYRSTSGSRFACLRNLWIHTKETDSSASYRGVATGAGVSSAAHT